MYINSVQIFSNQNFEAVRYKKYKSSRYKAEGAKRGIVPQKMQPKLTCSAHAVETPPIQVDNEVPYPWVVLSVAASGFR